MKIKPITIKFIDISLEKNKLVEQEFLKVLD
jgi:hypothetical protein